MSNVALFWLRKWDYNFVGTLIDMYDKEHLIKTKTHTGLTNRLTEVCIRKLTGNG
jgi:hypothetical protein